MAFIQRRPKPRKEWVSWNAMQHQPNEVRFKENFGKDKENWDRDWKQIRVHPLALTREKSLGLSKLDILLHLPHGSLV